MENKLPTDITLAELVREAKGLLAQRGILPTIQSIKKHLPENCPKYDLLILLERRYDKIVEDQVKGILSYEKENEELNKTRESLVNYINALKEADFYEQPAAETPDLRIGKTMYRIPQTMQVNQEAECHVWIAFDLETILKEVEQETSDETRDIRISNVMGVELLDHSQGAAFEITTYNETEQIIEKGLPTEWIFYVKPLKEGKFPLILRIVVIETVNGEKVHKTKVLREIVQIVAETPEEVITKGTPAKEAEGLVFRSAGENVAAAVPNAPKPQASINKAPSNWRKKIPIMGGVMAIFLGLIIAINVGLFENAQMVEIPVEGSDEIADLPDDNKRTDSGDLPSPKSESTSTTDVSAYWNHLKSEGDAAEISEFLEEFPNSAFEKEARDRLAYLNKKNDKSKPNFTKKHDDKTKPESPSPNVATPITVPTTSESPTLPTTKPSSSTQEEIPESDSESVASFKNVARKPVHPKCEKMNSSKREECTEYRIRKHVEDHLSKVVALNGEGVVSFIIDDEGKVTEIKMLKSDNSKLTKEVIRALNKLPTFQPGQNQLEVPVKVAYYLPVKVIH